MGQVRAFFPQDIPEVARLWQKVFRAQSSAPPRSLLSYIEEVFFDNPWRKLGLTSLVYQHDDAAIAGFLGVLPRSMLFRGRPIQVAISTQFMVDPDKTCPMAAVQLLKEFFAGPQDLSYTDGANDISLKLWQRIGGSASLLYSLEWMRTFRPARHAAEILSHRTALRIALAAARPALSVFDAAAAALPFGPYRTRRPNLDDSPASPEQLHECVTETMPTCALRPDYDVRSLTWLIGKASQKAAAGSLQMRVLRDSSRQLAGWYLYYLQPRGISQVLQMGARADSAGQVVDALFHHARRNGSVAVSGQFEPSFARELSDHHCAFRWLSLGVLVHSRRPEILDAIHRGDAFLSRLDGEWWLRFGRDLFK